MADPKFSVVVPVFNSELSLRELFHDILSAIESSGDTVEVILVDDGSTDRSWEVIRELKQANPEKIIAITLSKNYGQHNATLCGMGFAKGKFIFTLDDDLQTPPEEMLKLIERQKESNADLVYGIPESRQHSNFRKAGSLSLKKSSKLLHGTPGDGSSFRMIHADLVKKIMEHHQHFIFLDEILFWYTDDIVFTEVRHLPRKHNTSGYSIRKLIRMIANILLFYTMIPLKILVFGGFTVSLITFVYGLYFIFKKLVFDVPLGYTSMIVTILFSTSIILFSLGIIGEYLRRIYQIQNRKPPYSIRKVL